MVNKHIQILVEKYIDGLATPEEECELMDWYRTSNEKDIDWPDLDGDERERVRLKMLSVIRLNSVKDSKRVLKLPRIAAEAAIFIGLLIGSYYLVHRQLELPKITKDKLSSPRGIHPGANGAILTLAGGKKVLLGQASSGLIGSQGQLVLFKKSDSLLIYQKKEGNIAPAQSITYNTLNVPRGSHFQVVLPDGSKVWLNAASSLKFPTAFSEKTRTVELTGEAYFEVVHNNAQPFQVLTRNQIVYDMGTHFNIKAYPEDAEIKTTLLEGAVRISLKDGGQSKVLNPGQQAIVNQKIRVEKVDLSSTIAWKNGQFVFRSESLQSIMEQISRWYNMDIIYKDDLTGKSVWGNVSRYTMVSEVLNMIELTGVAHFRIEGQTIIVTK